MRALTILLAFAGAACSDVPDRKPPAGGFSPLSEIVVLGSLNGPLIFGDIEDVALGPEGSLFILDDQGPLVVHLDPDGTEVQVFDRTGEGPGEMTGPSELEIVGGAIALLDPPAGRVTMLNLGDSMSPAGSIPVNQVAWDFCSTSDRLFLHGSVGENLLYEIDESGNVVHSFAALLTPPEGELEGIQESFVDLYRFIGKVLCLDDRLILFGSESSIVRAFSLDGNEVWSTELQDFEVALYETDGARPSRAPEVEFDFVVSSFRWDDEHFVIQTESRGRDVARSVSSYLISIDTGTQVARSRDLPRIVAAQGERFVAVEIDPFPRIQILGR